MNKRIHAFIQGARQVLVIAPDTEYYRPQRGDFARDMRELRKDAALVSGDLHSTIKKYGEPIQNR